MAARRLSMRASKDYDFVTRETLAYFDKRPPRCYGFARTMRRAS
jgi:hypothetical protein